MDTYVDKKRKEEILKINLELEKAPPDYKDLIRDLVIIHCKGYSLLNILLHKKYRIKEYTMCEDEDKFYNTIKSYQKRFYEIFQFEITKLNEHLSEWVWGELEDNNLYSHQFSEYIRRRSFDFFSKNYLYIVFVYNTITKKFKVVIYNGLPESNFVYLVNNLDKLH